MTTETKIKQLKRDAQELGDTDQARILQGITEVLAELDQRVRDIEACDVGDIEESVLNMLVQTGVM